MNTDQVDGASLPPVRMTGSATVPVAEFIRETIAGAQKPEE